ncbi:MAG: maleylpyruvate isomerase family mycothiol-dependent enzyme, partial [Candidatus Nanopelagicales bacterium]
MSLLSARERSAVCSTLERTGPDAPTLCGDWNTSELAAHLVMREGHPAAAGIVLDFLADWTRRTQQSLAATDFDTLVQRVRSGPPWWSPLGWSRLESAANALELFIHHEDIL